MLNKQTMISIEDALPGREASMQIDDTHFVNQSSLTAQPQANQQQILFGMGCFWGAERLFWQLDGVISTSGRLRWRLYSKSNLRRSLLWKNRTHRSCSCRIR